MATFSPAAGPVTVPRHRKRSWLIAFAVGFLIGAAIGCYFISSNWPYRYRKIRPLLEDDLASQVEMSSYHRTYFPHPGFVATGLTLRRKTALDLPPFGHAEKLIVQGRWRDLLLLHQRVMTVEVTGLHIVIPPVGSRANRENFPPGSSSDFTGPDTVVEMFKFHNTVFEIMRNDGRHLIFPIRELDLAHFEKNQAVDYSVDMQNAIPSGRIQAHGTFGPLNEKQIGVTQVSGNFTFTTVTLHDVGNIAGTLAANGQFRGPLGAIEAQAESLTPNFSVDDGKPTPIAASVQCTVNGTNGDVAIHNIEARAGRTIVHVNGTVQGSPNQDSSGKASNFDIDVRAGRAEDVLRPFMHEDVPISGSVWLRGHAYLAPTGEGGGFLHRLHVDGTFDVPAGRMSDRDTEKSLSAFSQRAQGKKAPDEHADRSSSADVLSAVKGPAQVRDGIASSQHLIFKIPGAQADLSGTFNFHNKVAHLVGNLRMDTDISHTSTGFKSFLLKPLAPLFKKKKAGAVVPIAVTGGPGHYQVSQDILHEK
jgi:AsmA-like C-terminal region